MCHDFLWKVLNHKELLSGFPAAVILCSDFFSRGNECGCLVFALLIRSVQLKWQKLWNTSVMCLVCDIASFGHLTWFWQTAENIKEENKPKSPQNQPHTPKRKTTKTPPKTTTLVYVHGTSTLPLPPPFKSVSFCSYTWVGFFSTRKTCFSSSWSLMLAVSKISNSHLC